MLERQPGWRLWLGITLVCLLTVEIIVSGMSLLLKGAVTWDYLLTGLVASGLVAPVSLAALVYLLEASRQAKKDALELHRLRASKNMKVSLDAAHMLFWEFDPVSGALAFDDSRLHWLGFEPAAELHTVQGFLARVHPDDRAALQAGYRPASLRPADPGREYRICLPDGSWAWHRTVGRVAERDAAGHVRLIAGSTVNITEQVQAQRELTQSRQLLQSVIDTVPLRVYWKDRQSRYLGCNPVFAQDAGLASPQALVGKRDSELLWADQADNYATEDQQVMDTGLPKLGYTEAQAGRQGLQRWVRKSKVPLRAADGEVIGLLGVYEDVTAHIQAELALQDSNERANQLTTMLRLVSDNVPDMIWAKDLNKRYLFANKAICEQLLGASSTDEPLGRDDLFFAQRQRASRPDCTTWHTFGENCRDTDSDTLRSGRPMQFDESGFVRGRFVWLDVHKAPLLNELGQVIGVVGSARDVSAQKATQDKLRLAAMVLDNSSEAMLATDADNRIVEVNPAFTTLTGYTRDEVLGRDPSLLSCARQGPDFYKAMWHDLNTKGRWQGELWNKRKNGEVFAEWLTINTIYHEDGSVHRRVALFSDVTQKKLAEELIWKQANFDALTGLPNRRMFLDRLAQDMRKAQRSGHRLAVFFLDLDHFKEVNDTLGHEAGDLLLTAAAQRISACVRVSDTVARLGGDEFTVILPDVDAPAHVETIAQNIITALSRPYAFNEHLAQVTVSIGITFYPQDATQIETLLESADQAMYEAKRNGRNGFCLFARALQARAQSHADLMADLRLALDNGQMQLHFQPIVSLQTGKLHKVEALLRWCHPLRGMVDPAEFIALAEECGLIHALGDWVLAQALAQAQRWSSLAGKDVKLALNLSPLQLLQARVHRMGWGEQLAQSGLRGDHFVIEIPENLLHDSSPVVQSEIQAFQDAGTAVSVDHVGAGFTTFMALKKRQVRYFKIERTTIQNLAPDADELALVQAVVVMAHQLGLSVIAEGVETQQQHGLLRDIGCDFAQGYYYAKPMAADAIELLFATGGQLHQPA